jgi:hypothetical protein
VATTATLQQQMNNPVGALSTDNNGIVIVLPAVTEAGQTSVSGTLYYGINTQADNVPLGTVQFLTVTESGTLTTMFNGSSETGSVIDAGSSAYFFDDSSIPTCSDVTAYFCPASTQSLTATIEGENGVSSAQTFLIDNADTLFDGSTTTNTLTAFPTLGGPNGALNNIIPGFDWGLPFFYNRSTYVLFETFTVGGTTGPAVGF